MKCPSCGHDNPINRAYCEGCGQVLQFTPEQITQAMDEETRTEQYSHYAKQLRHVIFLLILALIGAYVFRGYARNLPEVQVGGGATAPRIEMEIPVATAMSYDGLGAPSFDENPTQVSAEGPSVESVAVKLSGGEFFQEDIEITLKRGGDVIRGKLIEETETSLRVKVRAGRNRFEERRIRKSRIKERRQILPE
jgi:hypothetical protein